MVRDARGVTLVELVMVVVLVAVLAGLAAPRFGRWLAGVRTSGALDTLAADLAYTRALAAQHGHRAVLRFGAGGPECPGGSGFRGAHAYTIVVRTRPERVVRTVSLRERAPRLCLEVSGSDSLVFNSRGLLVPFGNRKVRARLDAAADSLTISVLGRIRRRS